MHAADPGSVPSVPYGPRTCQEPEHCQAWPLKNATWVPSPKDTSQMSGGTRDGNCTQRSKGQGRGQFIYRGAVSQLLSASGSSTGQETWMW